MALILAFIPQTPQTRRPPSQDDASRGQILFFTGVRYERCQDDKPKPRRVKSPCKSEKVAS